MSFGNESIEREEIDGAVLTIFQDTDAEMPRGAWQDCYGVIVDWHRRADIGDTEHGDRKATETELNALRRGGWPLLKRYLRATEGAECVLPIGLLDHSGWHVYVGGGEHRCDPGGWDSGTVGFIYATRARREELGVPEDQIEKQLRGEIETLDQYFSGDVYGYVVEIAGEQVDSCWGFYGIDYVREEGRSAAEGARKRAEAEWIEEFI